MKPDIKITILCGLVSLLFIFTVINKINIFLLQKAVNSVEKQNEILTAEAHKIVYRKYILKMIDCRVAGKEIYIQNWNDTTLIYCGDELLNGK
jgi:hypothetical protein